ncbi:MAG: peptide chain release factor N(5)-glutamine methyltransferase [Dissulfurimicrobium sp.]|uniref:peptide chain release factor N(5)-glutamine methyltransferase n=1 Tax=Dissulfurimicrobium sp. TaxID=2022436 RepID=UPI00404AD153
MNVAQALKCAFHKLDDAGIEQPQIEAETILAHILKKDRLWLYLNPQEDLPPDILIKYRKSIERRTLYEPVAYITGEKEFWSFSFKVTKDTLIPRPETELLVETALSIINDEMLEPRLILDVGTGSGILAVSLAHELPAMTSFIATDISYDALLVAKENALRHGVASRINFIQTDWLGAFKKGNAPCFDMIVSNPPYVALDIKDTLPPDIILYEPHKALFGGADGLEDISRLIVESACVLKTGGWFICEIGWDQGDVVSKMADESGLYSKISILRDIAGNARALAAKRC